MHRWASRLWELGCEAGPLETYRLDGERVVGHTAFDSDTWTYTASEDHLGVEITNQSRARRAQEGWQRTGVAPRPG